MEKLSGKENCLKALLEKRNSTPICNDKQKTKQDSYMYRIL
jgi:hypothetical protein